MSIPANIRPQGPPVRPSSIPTSRGPAGFRPSAATISDAVRVTLVQSPGGGPVPKTLQNPTMASITTTSASQLYKQVTITPPNASKQFGSQGVTGGTTTMRIGNMPATSKMTVLPTATPLQTVSLAPTSHQINVPLGTGGTRTIQTGKLISVTGAGTGPSGPGPNNPPPGVTIQKSTIPVSSPS